MRTPFSDYTVSDPGKYTTNGTAFEFESPLLDPGELECENENVEMENYSYERFIREDSEVTNIDVQKAILFNKKYQTELWGSHVNSITKYFASIGITKDALPLSADNFALAVAKWQATVFTNPKSIDGAIGPISWNLLKTRISAVPVPAPAPTTTRSRWHSIITNTVSSPAIPLVHGKETFRQMVAAIKTATSSDHYIYILGWMLDVDFELIPGDKSSTLFQLLQDASKRKVEIRVLIWDSPLYIKEISNAATKINSLTNAVLIKDNATFGSPGIKSAISKIRFLLSQAPLFLRFINSWNDFVAKANTIQNEGSHHEKVLVVKGKEGLIGFCGGIDINPNRVKGVDSLGRSTVLHDIHCEVRGHAAWVLLHRFIWRWQVYKSRASLPTPKLLLAPLHGAKEPLPAAALHAANVAQVKILQTYNHPGNNIKDRSIREAVKLAIFNAKKSVHIEDQYMISLEIASWLNNKLANEPNFSSVTILTQDDDIAGEDILFPNQMRKKFIDQLVNGLSAANRKKIFIQMLHRSAPLTAHHKIHSKIYIIDDELAIIGSANLSSRSMTHDSETAAIIFNDTGAATNFASQLKAKLKADPDTNIISYAPNPNVKDIDVKVIDELNNLSTAKRIALAATGPALSLLIPQVIKMLVTQLKPALIDIIDPDADNTQPQQELEGWPESLQEDSMYNEREEQEAGMEELFLSATDESLENYQSEDNQQSEFETNAYSDQSEHGAEDLTFSNEQTTYLNESIEEISNGYFPAEKETAEVIENQVAITKTLTVNPKPCEGLTCWAKDALNKSLDVNLPLNNNLDEATKKAIGDFQVKNNLPQTQKIDPSTERALLEVDAMRRHKETALDQVATKTIIEAKKKIEDFTKQAVNNKPQYILNSYRDPRKVYAFVLHHMAYKRTGPISKKYSDPAGYLSTGAHFCIMLDGRIIQLHAISRMIWHGHCISPGSVAVEFEGNFPNIKGTWWYPTDKKTGKKIKVNEDTPTQAQFDSGRFLACYLKVVLGTTTILAHRQSDDSRENDPGPDIWFNVGQWAVDKLGLSDGGPTFKCGTGNPILPEWRTWGNKTTTSKESENYEITDETEWEDYNYTEEETKRSSTRYSQNAANIFLTLTGEKQGQIKGNILQKGKEGMIAVYAFHHEITSPRDAASGMATGKRIHKPIAITKEVDLSSAKLLSALVMNEKLKQVVINFWHPRTMGATSGTGVEVNYYRITLTNAFISNISQDRPATAEMNPTILERIELVYEKIEWQYLEGSSLTTADDWRQMNEAEFHEAIEEADWRDSENKSNYFDAIEENNSEQEYQDGEGQENNEELDSEEGYESETIETESPEYYEMKDEEATDDNAFDQNGFSDEMDDLAKDWSSAIRLNNYYTDKLGWNKYYDKINDFLLPYSGQQNVRLGEEAFAQAVAAWQQTQGFSAKDCDGIIGPITWKRLMPLISSTIAVSSVTIGPGTVAPLTSVSTVTPTPCITTFANQLPKHLEPKLVACINKIVPSVDIRYLFEKTFQANWGPIWIKELNTDRNTFLTYFYPNVNLTIELWRFVTIPKGDMALQAPLSKYLKAKTAGEFTVSIIGTLPAKSRIEKISKENLDKFVASAGPLASINQSYYWHVYATFPADVKNNFRQIEWSSLDKFTFNGSALSDPQIKSLRTTARDVVESWVSTSEKRYTKITLEGHTDSRGTEKFNLDLGKKRAQAAAEFIKAEIFSLAPQYHLDPSKMDIKYEIISHGESRPISKKLPIVHEFNRRVEITLYGIPVTVIVPLVLSDVIARCLKIVNANKNTIRTHIYKRIHCLLTKMLKPGVDDRYFTAQGALDVYNTNLFFTKDDWFRLRFFFTNQGFFNTQRPDNNIFKSLISIDQTIQDGVDQVYRIHSAHATIVPALPPIFEKLVNWMSVQAKNKDSIYSCY